MWVRPSTIGHSQVLLTMTHRNETQLGIYPGQDSFDYTIWYITFGNDVILLDAVKFNYSRPF